MARSKLTRWFDEKNFHVFFWLYWLVILQIGDRESNYDAFLADLCVKDGDADDCRYAIYDYEYVVHAQGTEASHRYVRKSLNFYAISKILVFRSRLFLVCWCPDSARIKKKMIYAASFDSLKKAFTGVQKVIQASGHDEIEQSSVEAALKAGVRT